MRRGNSSSAPIFPQLDGVARRLSSAPVITSPMQSPRKAGIIRQLPAFASACLFAPGHPVGFCQRRIDARHVNASQIISTCRRSYSACAVFHEIALFVGILLKSIFCCRTLLNVAGSHLQLLLRSCAGVTLRCFRITVVRWLWLENPLRWAISVMGKLPSVSNFSAKARRSPRTY